MQTERPVQIAIADDHDMVREGLKLLVEANGQYKIVIEASSGLDLVKQLKASEVLPEICMMDLSMHPLNGYETLQVIKKKWPEMKTIILSMYESDWLVSRFMKAGAGSYLSKNCGANMLFEALDEVHKNGAYQTEAMAKLCDSPSGPGSLPKITDKELRFLCLCSRDLTHKEIATIMEVETRTVDNYRDSLFKKLNIHTRGGLVAFANTTGLINLSVDYLVESGLLK